ncbi:unnamed protein product [Prorocentrum cordatum]|uniref:Uncharacterized protein n=1 Tax=Prorocentrum cordatum TaxID=2364126 RepID=A0ABN9VE79_9DINO|nr:unnamed protein product [Polarella glacialis]
MLRRRHRPLGGYCNFLRSPLQVEQQRITKPHPIEILNVILLPTLSIVNLILLLRSSAGAVAGPVAEGERGPVPEADPWEDRAAPPLGRAGLRQESCSAS